MRLPLLIRLCRFSIVFGILILAVAPRIFAEQPTPASLNAFNAYAVSVETRLATQHRTAESFLPLSNAAKLRAGQIIVENLTPATGAKFPGALLHDWRGTAFIAGANAADFEHLLKTVDEYPRLFSPQVVVAKTLSVNCDHRRIWMRVRQRHVITVRMDTTYDVDYGHLDAQHGFSLSRSTNISELDSSGHPVSPAETHGFLWRMNTYWTYEQQDGGLYIQVESISLTRSVPTGLVWLVGPYVESVPRESIEFTLRSVCNALRGLRVQDRMKARQTANISPAGRKS